MFIPCNLVFVAKAVRHEAAIQATPPDYCTGDDCHSRDRNDGGGGGTSTRISDTTPESFKIVCDIQSVNTQSNFNGTNNNNFGGSASGSYGFGSWGANATASGSHSNGNNGCGYSSTTTKTNTTYTLYGVRCNYRLGSSCTQYIPRCN